MKTLISYEFKKVLSQKAYWGALLVMLLILAANEATPVVLGNYQPKRNRELSLSGTVIDDAIIWEIRAAEDPHEYDPIYEFIKNATGRTDLSSMTAGEVYQTRDKVNNDLMTESKVSEEERSFWKGLDEKNKTPFVYRYDGAYEAFFGVVYFLSFMELILCGIGLSGLYADEKVKKTDQIIFGTRLGRKQLFYAKLIVGGVCGFVSSCILLLEELILSFALYGTDGADAILQIHIPQCMMNITMGQAVLYLSLLVIANGVFLGVITMFLSQVTMNHSGTMAFMIFFLFLSMYNPAKSVRLLSMLWDMLPGAYAGSWLFETYTTVKLFGTRLNILQYTPIFWTIVGVVLILIAGRSYRRYEVRS